MLRIRVPSLGEQAGGGAGSVDITGSVTQGAQTASGTLTNPVDLTGSVTQGAHTASGTITNPVDVSGTPTQGAQTGSGTITNPVDLTGSVTQGAHTGSGEFFAGAVDLVGDATQAGDTASGVLDTGGAEAFPRGGFLPDDWEERDRRSRRIRKTLEGVASPKPAQVARQMREALAPAQEPAPVMLRDAVRPETMEKLRRLADSAAARQAALDDDDEDVLMLLGV